ncbi:biotin--[acetyl-CoA-carboxylase] ligase [Flavobacterium sediminilitoris]|uniref:Biotin--[acetyl-CoA-carboxylase] ligase n=1 Tax=Flavobacterium sediminilitoris TaxID=2024526 RepID=A0ABY4HNA4_9FLAO|nr:MULTISPECIES: biotin--[acetyl-CoA-carboxylase] ligase [Flavobacterium]UOX33751.1 biotin--[acetyl-CoA-carboxylase] ligase [Flavobacterium sediminilitoris]
MNIIKLNAIASTNDFLRQMSAKEMVENFTVVVAENQLNGKGQRGSVWVSENGKNLTFSVFVKDFQVDVSSIYLINIIVPITIIEVLTELKLVDLAIKWPNDILSENKKIGGILIENAIKSDGMIQTVVGIGLNINQMSFDNLPQASSLAILKKEEFDKDLILKQIIERLKFNMTRIGDKSYFWDKYNNLLFRKDIPTVFVNNTNQKFMAIVKGVTNNGKLQLLLEDDTINEYDIKEVKMLY